jgi:hypothetical protein
MNPQLEGIVEEFMNADRRLHDLAAGTPEESWLRRPAAGSWSAAECLAHLNLTSAGYIPILEDAISLGRQSGRRRPPVRYRHDFPGWLLWKMMGPRVPLRVKTTAPFVPKAVVPRSELIADFERLQREQIRCVKECEGVAMDRIRITSPFDARLRYSFYSSLAILPRHQQRHLRQAERALIKG